jgi:hypothetical protein
MTAPIVERVARAIAKQVASGAGVVTHGDTWRDWIPEARASIAVQRELIQQLREAAMHGHAYMGACPDAVNDWTARDPQCPACQAIATAEEALREQP